MEAIKINEYKNRAVRSELSRHNSIKKFRYECEPSGSVGNEAEKKSNPSAKWNVRLPSTDADRSLASNRVYPWMPGVAMLSSDEEFSFWWRILRHRKVGRNITLSHSIGSPPLSKVPSSHSFSSCPEPKHKSQKQSQQTITHDAWQKLDHSVSSRFERETVQGVIRG